MRFSVIIIVIMLIRDLDLLNEQANKVQYWEDCRPFEESLLPTNTVHKSREESWKTEAMLAKSTVVVEVAPVGLYLEVEVRVDTCQKGAIHAEVFGAGQC